MYGQKGKNRMKANLGKRFERIIESANRQYQIEKVAAIEKQEIKTKLVNGKMIYEKKGPPDFMGAIQGGRMISFDAKSTAGHLLPLKNITHRWHQLDFLQRVDKLGGLAFYLVEFTDFHQYYILPVSQVQEAIRISEAGGRKSIPIEDFTEEVKSSFTNALDYLQPFLK